MDEFEQKVKEYLQKAYPGKWKSWVVYEIAKRNCTDLLNPSAEEYPIMIKIITDYLGL